MQMQHRLEVEGAADFAALMRAECMGVRIGRLHRVATRTFEQALAPLGLSLPQLEMLSTLTLVGRAIRPGELADLLGVERSTTSRNMALMQDRGWARTTKTSPTGRSLAYEITESGSAQLAAASQAWHTAQATLLEALGPDAAGVMDGWLRALWQA